MRLFFLLISFTSLFSNGQLSVNVTIRTISGGVLSNSNTSIVLGQEKKQSRTTDENGQVSYEVSEPGNYTFFYAENVKGFEFEMKEGRRGNMSRTLTYDPDGVFALPTKADRGQIVFSQFDQKNVKFEPKTGKCGYEIVLKNLRGKPAANVKVSIVDIQARIKYNSSTDSKGVAKFFINSGRSYELDVNDVEAIDFIKVPAVKYGVFRRELPFEQLKISQRVERDTIFQSNINQNEGTTTHAYAKIKLLDYSQNELENEKIFLNDQNSNAVYVGITNTQGEAEFMLKNGTDYVMHLTLEREVRLINLENTRGFKQLGLTHVYRGTENIREILANRKRDDKGFIQKFDETPIEKIDGEVIETEVSSNGLKLKTGKNGKVPTITIGEGDMFFSEGFYSPNFYSYDPINKKVNWAVKLGESGAGTAVYSNGVLLINTYSCTLYALEAKTGNLFWSKYLANTLYSIPSVISGSVLVVYDNEMEGSKEESYVLANFDLKTGKVNWQEYLSEDAIACPVLIDEEVHVASTNGTYKVFGLKNGEVLKEKDLKARTSPTIEGENIYITIERNGEEMFVKLNRKSLEEESQVNLKDSIYHPDSRCFERMHYQGSRSVRYKKMNYLISDSKLICIDPKAEKIVWKQDVGAYGQLRSVMVANNQVFVQTDKSELMYFDAITGKQVNVVKTNCPIWSQPSSKLRRLYYSDNEGLIYIQNVNVSMDFPQWLGNASHNPVYAD